MAKAVLVVQRLRGRVEPDDWVDVLQQRLTPDNVVPRAAAKASRDGVTAMAYDPSAAMQLKGESIAIGKFFGPVGRWQWPGGDRPEGCYALLRTDDTHAELVADAAATRTLWYVKTPDLFVASTSQRAIATILGSFEPNPAVIGWMLSSGTLGPENGWDARVRQVLPGERVTLNRARWQLTHEIEPVEFAASRNTDETYHAERLRAVLESTLGRCDFTPERWAFLLSGGIDSRGLLAFLSQRDKLRTITWGLRHAPDQALNDARIARGVAEAFGLEHQFLPTDLTEEPRETLIRRFIVAGEGRTAAISPFVDGFEVWRTLRTQGLDGAIRGDEAFGSRFVRDAYEVRHTAKLTMLADYFAPEEIDALELPQQFLPPRLAQRQSETLATWRDRVYQQHRLPTFLAALTDLQTAYVDVTNPLLARSVLHCVRALPDRLRTSKRLWHKVARMPQHQIPLARRVAVLPIERFVSDTATIELMLAEMETTPRDDALSAPLREWMCATLRAALCADPSERAQPRHPNLLSLLAPRVVRRTVQRLIALRPECEPLVFAFRAFIASRTIATLKEDTMATTAKPTAKPHSHAVTC